MQVTLEKYEMGMAAMVGSRRQYSAILKKSKLRFDEQYPGQIHENHIRSAMAELAVAKALNIYWGGHVDTYRTVADVGCYEVRYSMRRDLKVKDDDTGVVISVYGCPPVLELIGWIYADEAQAQTKYKKDFDNGGPPAFFIPHGLLHKMEKLQ